MEILYRVLEFLGYSKNFIKWIILFNTEITAYVIQCGFLSKPIKINRGCRQGDPISAYLFLIGAEILARLIQLNPDIVGLKIKNLQISKLNFYKLIPYPMDNSLSGRRRPARQTSEKDVLCLHRLGRPSSVHSPDGVSYFLPV